MIEMYPNDFQFVTTAQGKVLSSHIFLYYQSLFEYDSTLQYLIYYFDVRVI
jgi:hypothetical protein